MIAANKSTSQLYWQTAPRTLNISISITDYGYPKILSAFFKTQWLGMHFYKLTHTIVLIDQPKPH